MLCARLGRLTEHVVLIVQTGVRAFGLAVERCVIAAGDVFTFPVHLTGESGTGAHP